MNILVIRLSAMGDIAMLYPELYRLIQAYPHARIVLLTRKQWAPLFTGLSNVTVVSPDLEGKHRGFPGLVRLFFNLKKMQIHKVLDMHAVLRSKVIGNLFRFWGVPVFSIDKGRRAKKALTRKENKARVVCKHSAERYREVFYKAGFVYEATEVPPIFEPPALRSGVGVAPFAGFSQKEWPWEKVEVLVGELAAQNEAVYLFGAPGVQRQKLHTLAQHTNVHVAEAHNGLMGEIELMAKLRVMVSMDSGNGHLAALAGCPVVTIWGATHRDAGFAPVGKTIDVEISTDELPCRPCSVFGNKPCWRGDFACMQRIEINRVMDAIKQC